MAAESFLINPARLRGRTKVRRRRRKGGLPGTLLSRMMRTHGRRRGMKEAWKAYRGGVRRNEPDPITRRRRRRYHKNPLGEEVIIVGANPRRRRVKRVRRRRRRMFFNEPEPKRGVRRAPRKARRRRRRRAAPRKSFLRRLFRRNPKRRRAAGARPARRRRRRRGRGAGAAAGLPAISIRRPMSLIVPVAFGTASYLACDIVPGQLGMVTNFPRLGVKAAVLVGGSMIVSKFAGRSNAVAVMLGAGINILQDVLRTWVFKTAIATTTGFGAFPGAGYQLRPRVHDRITPY